MLSIPTQTERFASAGALHERVNIVAFINESSFMTKSGEVASMLRLERRDAENVGPADVAADIVSVVAALRSLDERFLITQYLVKRSNPIIDEEHYDVPALAEAVQTRTAFLRERAAHLYTVELYLLVLLRNHQKVGGWVDWIGPLVRNPVRSLSRWLSAERRVVLLDNELRKSARLLRVAVKSLAHQLSETGSAQVLDRQQIMAFFRRLLNPNREKAEARTKPSDFHLDYWAVDSELEAHRGHLRLDDSFIKVLTLKTLPAETKPNILTALASLDSECIVAIEWGALDSQRAVGQIRSRQRHAHNTKLNILSFMGSERPHERDLLYDKSKEHRVDELGDCLSEVENHGSRLGEFSLSLILLGRRLEEVERASAKAMRIAGSREFALNEERYNLLNAFFAALPGGYPFNLRQLLVTDRNLADVSFWFLPANGSRWNHFLNAPCLANFETREGGLYGYNLHVGDVGHTLVLGSTGAGKTFWLLFVLLHAQKYLPYTFVFDFGGGFRWLVQLLNGTYISVRGDKRPFSIWPFVLEPTPSNLEFLFSFCRALIESGGHQMNEDAANDLFATIKSLYTLEPQLRTLSTLMTLLQRSTAKHLKRWTKGEQYGDWFDNNTDTVSFAKCQCVNFEDMDSLGVVLEPLLFYLLHRANAVVYDPALATTLKLFVIDEAWRFFKHPAIRAYLFEGLKTWRKKNATAILATHALEDLSAAEVLRVVAENCPTRILFSNPVLDPSLYGDVLRLSPTEQECVRQLQPKREFLLKRDSISKVLRLDVDPKSYWLFTTDPYEAKRREDAVREHGLQTSLEMLKGAK